MGQRTTAALKPSKEFISLILICSIFNISMCFEMVYFENIILLLKINEPFNNQSVYLRNTLIQRKN